MSNLSYINFIIAIVFVTVTCYQMLYMGVKFFKKPKKYAALKLHKYAVVICARNEEAVIAQLIESIKSQDYPADLVDTFVVADNCTDKTAEIARQAGARVYERFNKVQVGKGFALSYFFDQIKEAYGERYYDGYYIFDADNLLDEHYITEMNKVFSNGYTAVTSYRNTKNYGDSWVSACYGLWFLREAEYLNYSRNELGVSCAVSGTGFLVSSELIEKNGGWIYHTLTEDLEFTADMITRGEKIGYCHEAIIYDEQPVSLSQSITQRSRWMKGSMQVMGRYSIPLIKGIIKKGSLSCYDMLMGALPSVVLAIFSFALNIIMFIFGMVTAPEELGIFFESIFTTLINSYFMLVLIGFAVVVTEWKRIHCTVPKKILYTLMYPVFVLSFTPAIAIALLRNVEWKPIKHNAAISITEMKTPGKKAKKKPIY